MRKKGQVAAAILLTLAGVGGTAAYAGWGRPEPTVSSSVEPRAPAERVRVEVLNAGGVSGRAREATAHVRDAGFDVVGWGNAVSFDRDSSVVIDRVGRGDLASAVANVLGIRNVLSEPDSNLFVEVTVLLGSEWSRPMGEGEGTRTAPARAWWDPRGWLGR